MINTIPRDLLFKALGDERLVRAFEDQSARLEEVEKATGTGAKDTQALNEATVITLSRNQAFTNERILKVLAGLRLDDDGESVTLSLENRIEGGYSVTFTAMGETELILPISGTLVTRQNFEVLSNKTLAGLYLKVRTVNEDVEVEEADSMLAVDTASTVTVTLPALRKGRHLIVKKVAGAGTVTVEGPEMIDGQPSLSISTLYTSYTLVGGETEWHIV